MKKNFFRLLSVALASLTVLVGCDSLYELTGKAQRDALAEDVGEAKVESTFTYIGWSDQKAATDTALALKVSFTKPVTVASINTDAGTYALSGNLGVTLVQKLGKNLPEVEQRIVGPVVSGLPRGTDSTADNFNKNLLDAEGNVQVYDGAGVVEDFDGTSLHLAMGALNYKAATGDTYTYTKTVFFESFGGFVSASEKNSLDAARAIPALNASVAVQSAFKGVRPLDYLVLTDGTTYSFEIELSAADILEVADANVTASTVGGVAVGSANVSAVLNDKKDKVVVSFTGTGLQNSSGTVTLELTGVKAKDREDMPAITVALPNVVFTSFGALTGSGATSVRLFNDNNTYAYPFQASALIRYGANWNSPITADGLTNFASENGNINLEVITGNTSGVAQFDDPRTNYTEYKFVDGGTVTTNQNLGAVYDADAGTYTFTVDKSKFLFGVNRLTFATIGRSADWGGTGDFGIGANAIPAQTTTGRGAKTYNAAATIAVSSANADEEVTYLLAEDRATGIRNIGYRNVDGRFFEIVVKGSFIESALRTTSGFTESGNPLWGPVLITLGYVAPAP